MCVSCVDKRKVIIDWVDKKRKELSIKTTPGRKLEPSCEMFGEFQNLIGQLLKTDIGTGVWEELNNENVLSLVYDGIEDRK